MTAMTQPIASSAVSTINTHRNATPPPHMHYFKLLRYCRAARKKMWWLKDIGRRVVNVIAACAVVGNTAHVHGRKSRV